MKRYDSFELLKKLSFERMASTKEELKASRIIQDEIASLGFESELESFSIDMPEIKAAKLEVLAPYKKTYTVTGYGMTGSTSESGLEAPLCYIEEGTDINLCNVKGKIALVHKRMMKSLYQKLLQKGAVGFIVCSGSVYDKEEETDLEWNIMRPHFYEMGKIPGLTIRIKDAHEMVLNEASLVKMTLIEEEKQEESHNVIVTIPGNEKKEEVIAFTAHYDSVRFSTGAYDNATGSTTLLEILAHFKDTKPSRTLKFIWCGAEERGLLGSKAYTNSHKDELEQYKLCINVDMTGVVLGYDLACCTSEMALVNYLNYFSLEQGFSLKAYQGVYSSDSTPFADHGIPAVSFARIAPAGGAQIHSRRDVLTYLDSKNYYKTADFIINFATKMDKAYMLPVERVIPNNMKDEIDYYYFRKERPKK